MQNRSKKNYIIAVAAITLVMGGYYWWQSRRDSGPGEGFAGGNGRIEATEIDISTKLAGRVEGVLVNEGDFVEAGQVLAIMQTDVLQAQLAEARAQHQQSLTAEASAKSQVVLRQSDQRAAEAVVAQREAELDAVQRRLDRTTVLSQRGAVPDQQYDDEVTSMHASRAAVATAEAQVAVAQASVEAARAEVEGAGARVEAAQATIERIEADIKDSSLTAPRSGRIQYRIAQPGEVLGIGGKVLNLVDLSDVYMTFFLPTAAAGAVEFGSEVRIVLDVAPAYPVPAYISYVASTAQFTPKTVETMDEREKLMFRVKAKIKKELLAEYLKYVKTGLPGMAWVKLNPNKEWPANLAVREFK